MGLAALAIRLIALCAAVAYPVFAQEGDWLAQLLSEKGIQLTESKSRQLRPPTLAEALSAKEQQQRLAELAGSQGWERFSRNSITAPVKIDLEYILDENGERIGHDVHAAFVAYAAIKTLRDEDLMRQVFGKSVKDAEAQHAAGSEDETVRDIPADELKRLGIAVPNSASERYASIELPLLNKVIVRGTIRIEKRESDRWVHLYWYLDPRFGSSTQYSNTWTKILRNDVGMPIESEPHPYAGCGGFVSVTRIASNTAGGPRPDTPNSDPSKSIPASTDQLLIESRLIMMEPKGWFAGSNTLRAKLPLVLQENARNFRRQLSK